jgi:molybdopterin-guanine dinucleotide biosynthesis protein A
MQTTNAAGFVLAGGKSSRMGRDKALVELRGQPLVAWTLQILREAGLPVAIAGGQPGLNAYAPVIADLNPGLGPLSGICAALATTQTRWAIFVSVDQPLLPPALLRSLLHHAQGSGSPATFASIAGFVQTFPAVVDRTLLSALQAELKAGRSGCFSALKAAAIGQPTEVLAAEALAQSGQVSHPSGIAPENWFLNLNSADDLRLAEAIYPSEPRKP